MKRYQKWLATLVVVLTMITGFSVNKSSAQPDGYVSYQTFYDELSPYGEWINDPQYGYVWVPDVDQNFQPYYTEGRWVMTEYGNTWVSDYSWGWAPFHYGRWTYDEYYGWLWIPDTQWGPAWVSWRSGGGYYGWAPLGPGISISTSWGGYNAPYDWWVFIPCGNIYSHNYYNYYRGPRYNQNYIRNTTVINYTNNYNHVTYTTGPRVNEIRNYVKTPVRVYNVRNQTRPSATVVASNSVNIYRPQIRNGGGRPAPQAPIRPDHRIGAPKPVSVNNGRPQGLQELRARRNNTRPGQSGGNPPRNPNVRQPQTPDRQQPVPQAPRQQPQREPRQVPVQQNTPREQQAPRQQPQREPRQVPVQQQQPRMEPQREPRQQPQRMDRPQPAPQQQREQPQREQRPMPQPRQERPQPAPQQPRTEPQREQRQMPAQQQPRVERPQPQPQQERPAEREHGGRR